ncbi:hypothetical protein HYV12_03100 [Candidatus Dojkabacteria bacterium]|nr:hypothetical protein [Candidatus Dojkabacteria bacterium]
MVDLWGKDVIIIYNTSPEHEDLAEELKQTAYELLSEDKNTVVKQVNHQELKDLRVGGVKSFTFFTMNAQDSYNLKGYLQSKGIWISAQDSNLVRRFMVSGPEEMISKLESLKDGVMEWDEVTEVKKKV